ncbi:serine hydrolase domain-containing protein [Nocardia callitridis]|uniref:Serine hydrolase domain-containing protein n=1 Tax=Nocardia callitridis TaxID=648753 RepID=A0ABP9KHK8_9NOCA
MSTVASGELAALPDGVGGSATAEFASLARVFARTFGHRGTGGAGLTIHRHGMPLVDIWTGSTGTEVWRRDTGSIVFSATKGITATVIHRLADRGLLDYSAPVAEYWPEFAAAGKGSITVRQLMTHRAGLSALGPLVRAPEELLDARLMQERLAAAKPDRLLGHPAYHALTFGWLMAGLARAVTGRDLPELFRTEVAEPLGIDGLHLGAPPPESSTVFAPLVGSALRQLGNPISAQLFGRGHAVPGALGAAVRCLFVPGVETILAGDHPPILAAQMGAASGVCTAPALATLYSALAGDGKVDGREYLRPRTLAALRKVETYRLDHALFYLPMLWHLGYHSLPVPGGRAGFGHIGLGGSFGWAEPRLGLSVGFVHNRLSAGQLGFDQTLAFWLLPMIMNCLRGARATDVARPAEAA